MHLSACQNTVTTCLTLSDTIQSYMLSADYIKQHKQIYKAPVTVQQSSAEHYTSFKSYFGIKKIICYAQYFILLRKILMLLNV